VSLWSANRVAFAKEEFISAFARFEQVIVVMHAQSKIFIRHRMNILLLVTAGKASSKSLRISEIASGSRARNGAW
jgi:hypothetical protein